MFPLNDFFALDRITNELLFKVQAKSSLEDIRDTKTNFFSVVNIKEQHFSMHSAENDLPRRHFEELHVIKKAAGSSNFQLEMSRSIVQTDSILKDKALLNDIRFHIANDVAFKGPLLSKKDSLPLQFPDKKSEDV